MRSEPISNRKLASAIRYCIERSRAKSLGEAPSSYLPDQKTAAHPFPTEQTVEAWKTPAASGDTRILSPCHGLEALHGPAITIEP